MSLSLISRNADLARLRTDGYDIVIWDGYLVLRGVPYVTETKQVVDGQLVAALTISSDGRTVQQGDHTALFAGAYPCDHNGQRLEKIVADTTRRQITEDLATDLRFSHKPASGSYADFYAKMTAYANILTAYARRIDPTATAARFAPIDTTEDASVFRYADTAASRAGIGMIASKLAGLKIAIIGLGGSGAYIADLVAKTAVAEIHFYDGDRFLWHNAFRSPGAPGLDEVIEPPFKVDYYATIYSRFRGHVIAHPVAIEADNVGELYAMDFVFIAVDDGAARKLIATALEESRVPFIDVGIGVFEVDHTLAGIVRVTTSTPAAPATANGKHRLPFGDGAPNAYATNIQVAELNALSATLAVIRWKKHFGFYLDLEREGHSLYTIDGNAVTNDDDGGGGVSG